MKQFNLIKEGSQLCPRCSHSMVIALCGKKYLCSECFSQFEEVKDYKAEIKAELKQDDAKEKAHRDMLIKKTYKKESHKTNKAEE